VIADGQTVSALPIMVIEAVVLFSVTSSFFFVREMLGRGHVHVMNEEGVGQTS